MCQSMSEVGVKYGISKVLQIYDSSELCCEQCSAAAFPDFDVSRTFGIWHNLAVPVLPNT